MALSEAASGENTWSYDEAPELNRFSTPGSPSASFSVKKTPCIAVRIAKTDITVNDVALTVKGFVKLAKDNGLKKSTGTLAAPQLLKADVQPYSVTPKWKSVDNADYYEVEFQGENYSTIRGNELTFNDLTPQTDYDFKVRAVNASGVGEWTPLHVRTAVNPLEFALHGLTATSTAKDMEGFGIEHLFDFATTGDIWHTYYYSKAVPFDFTVDLHGTSTLDKIQYLPRADAGNGTITRADIQVSRDGKTWTEIGEQTWARNAQTKEVKLTSHPEARYVKVKVLDAVGGFGSGRELYVFKVPGTKTLIPGDINNDGKIDDNDLTSYMNYTGLKKGDSDFDGYISVGDVNNNGLIDAYDISNVTTKLDGGVYDDGHNTPLAGKFSYEYDKKAYKAGDDVTVKVKGHGMQSVNAFNFVLPYRPQDMRFVKAEAVAAKDMRNMTYDRHHSDGSQVLYPTFANVGNQSTLNGDETLCELHFKAVRSFTVKQQAPKGMAVDKNLNELDF